MPQHATYRFSPSLFFADFPVFADFVGFADFPPLFLPISDVLLQAPIPTMSAQLIDDSRFLGVRSLDHLLQLPRLPANREFSSKERKELLFHGDSKPFF